MIKKYSFRKYSKDFSKIFNREKSKIKKILPNAKIEHVGSTAVEGLGGKGIVDIAVAVPKKEINMNKEKRIFMKPGKNNQEDRLNFIEFWANYIKTNKDEEWSKQQAALIDSQIKNARSFNINKKDCLKLKDS